MSGWQFNKDHLRHNRPTKPIFDYLRGLKRARKECPNDEILLN